MTEPESASRGLWLDLLASALGAKAHAELREYPAAVVYLERLTAQARRLRDDLVDEGHAAVARQRVRRRG